MANVTLSAGQIGVYDKTLIAAAVDTVAFAHDCDRIEVASSGTAAVYFTVDGSNPTIGGANTYKLPAVLSVRDVAVPTPGATVVKLISAGTPTYDVSEAS